MDNEQEISKALQLRGRMQDIIRRGYTLMNDMQATPSDAYATTLAYVWNADALQEMPISLGIITQALQDIQTQCPNLSAVIFPQQEMTDDI
jgi:predicted amidohydrolase YtcJ